MTDTRARGEADRPAARRSSTATSGSRPTSRPASRPNGRPVNAWLSGGAVALSVYLLFVLPWLPLVWAWTVVPLVLATTPFWSLIHEAVHGTLFPDRKVNDRAGRALSVLYGGPFALLKAGHLLHHRYSRTRLERSEIYDPASSSWVREAPAYYSRLFGGLYLAELASVLLALLPSPVLLRLARRLDSPDSLTGLVLERVAQARVIGQFRRDSAAVVLVHAASFACYGRHWWVLAGALLGRAVVVSVADNSYHYGTKLDAPLEAMNLQLPMPLERFTLSFNLHDVHHRHPGLPWYELRGAFVAERGTYHLGWFRAVARQLRGPVGVAGSDGLPTGKQLPTGPTGK